MKRPGAEEAGAAEVAAPGSREHLEDRVVVVQEAQAPPRPSARSCDRARASRAGGRRPRPATTPSSPSTSRTPPPALHEGPQPLGRGAVQAHVVQDHHVDRRPGPRGACRRPGDATRRSGPRRRSPGRAAGRGWRRSRRRRPPGPGHREALPGESTKWRASSAVSASSGTRTGSPGVGLGQGERRRTSTDGRAVGLERDRAGLDLLAVQLQGDRDLASGPPRPAAPAGPWA